MVISQKINEPEINLPQILSGGQELKITVLSSSGQPAVGVLDVLHQFPEKQGKGIPKISWAETLEWGPSVTSPSDSWQKTITVKNHSRSPQDVVIRFFFIRS